MLQTKREPIWWLPLLRRVVVWGASSGCCVGALFFVLSLILALLSNFGDPYALQQMCIFGCLLNAIKVAAMVGIPACGVGLIIGWSAGLCAPAREPKNLLVSPFYRSVVAETLMFWLIVLFAFGVMAVLASIVLEPWTYFLSSELLLYGTAFLLFCLSLWRAVNRALTATKLK